MPMLLRHPWSIKLQDWLISNKFQFKTHSFARAEGTAEMLFLGNLNSPRRPLVLFLHGLGNDALFPNVGFFKYILKAGYNILTTDLDGHGKGNTTKLDAINIFNLVADMVKQSESFQIGKPRLHLCGYSFGATLLLKYAVHNPELVASLSLIGMPLTLKRDIRVASEILTPLTGSYRLALKDYGITGITPALGPFLRDRYPIRVGAANQSTSLRDTPSSVTRDTHYLNLAGSIIKSINPLELLKVVTFPTLYIFGTQDFIARDDAAIQEIRNIKIQTFPLKHETHFSSMLSIKTARRIEVLLRNSL